ncbi:hypothetical protein [Streptomyces noursei]|uniref:hypothetical protein n=1 Tax=Streptomyces noursei TaxID=1971 RepID=UPI0030F25A61
MHDPAPGKVFEHRRTDAVLFAVDDVRTPLDLDVAATWDAVLVITLGQGVFERRSGAMHERFPPGDVFVESLQDRT